MTKEQEEMVELYRKQIKKNWDLHQDLSNQIEILKTKRQQIHDDIRLYEKKIWLMV